MSRSSKIYAYIISAVGISLGSYCVYLYFQESFTKFNPKQGLAQFGVLTFLYIICRCLPIYIRDDYTIDMSFVCNLASIFCFGPVFSAAMVTISMPFIITPTNTGEKNYNHIFNRPPIKTAFNAENPASGFKGTYYEALCESMAKGFTAFEKQCDDYLMLFVKDAKYISLTLEPLVAYIYARETEVKTVRIILNSKVNNIDPDVIKERLRDAYV